MATQNRPEYVYKQSNTRLEFVYRDLNLNYTTGENGTHEIHYTQTGTREVSYNISCNNIIQYSNIYFSALYSSLNVAMWPYCIGLSSKLYMRGTCNPSMCWSYIASNPSTWDVPFNVLASLFSFSPPPHSIFLSLQVRIQAWWRVQGGPRVWPM